jgi:hypothetical protein
MEAKVPEVQSSSLFYNMLKTEGFVRKANKIFYKNFDQDWSVTVSFSSSDFSMPILGVINQRVNKIMYSVLAKAIPPSPKKLKPTRLGPAICLVPLNYIVGNSKSGYVVTNPEIKSDPFLESVENVQYLLEMMLNVGFPYFKLNLDLRSAVNSAYHSNKFFQSTRYCIPVALLLLNEKREFKEYTRQCILNFKHKNEILIYEKYVTQLLSEAL